jgi:hypothetical protein
MFERTWLRRRLIRLRTIWRFAKDPRNEAGLREFIAEAEDRLETQRVGAGLGCVNDHLHDVHAATQGKPGPRTGGLRTDEPTPTAGRDVCF